jgi:hypothetical protein
MEVRKQKHVGDAACIECATRWRGYSHCVHPSATLLMQSKGGDCCDSDCMSGCAHMAAWLAGGVTECDVVQVCSGQGRDQDGPWLYNPHTCTTVVRREGMAEGQCSV